MNFFLSRYKELGHDFRPADMKLANAVRINTLKISEEEFVARFSEKFKLKKIPFTDDGYWVESDFSLSSTPEYLKG